MTGPYRWTGSVLSAAHRTSTRRQMSDFCHASCRRAPNNCAAVRCVFGNICFTAEGGEVHLGTMFSTAGNLAVNGIVAFEGQKLDKLRALTGALDQTYVVIVAFAIGHHFDPQIREKKMKVQHCSVAADGHCQLGHKVVLEAHRHLARRHQGVGVARSIRCADSGWAGNAMKDGRADCGIHRAPKGHPKVTEVAETTTCRRPGDREKCASEAGKDRLAGT